MPSSDSKPVVIHAPASVGNFGPGFDAFALALHGLGDRVELRPGEADRVRVEGPGSDAIPTAWRSNVAGLALDALRRRTRTRERFEVRIRKGMPGGSGLGSSASSAGGAALAFHAAHPGLHLGPGELVDAAASAEGHVSGRHFDDVAAVVMGGLAIVRADGPRVAVARVQPPANLHIAGVRPHVALPTRRMRAVLPSRVAREDAVKNVANASALVDAFHRADLATVGACLEDRIAFPARRRFLPFFGAVRRAALDADALGVAVSGSGPAMVAVCDSARRARDVAAAMRGAMERTHVDAEAFAARPEREVMHRAVALR